MTLEEQLDMVSDTLSEMSDRSKEADEWNQINSMHLILCEFRGQLSELRQMEHRNAVMRT